MSLGATMMFASGGQTGSGDGWITRWFPFKTFAGTVVNESVALQVTAVYRAIALISEAVAMLPLGVFQRMDDGRREERSDHPVAEILRRPNQSMSAVDLRSALQGHVLQYGNAYVDIQRDQGGRPLALWPLLPDRTRPVGKDIGDGTREVVYRTVVEGKPVDMKPADVCHIRGLAFDGLVGYSPLRLAQQAVGLALGLEQYGSQFFGNDARSGGFIEHPGKLSAEAQQRIIDSMSAQGGLQNAHRVKILEEGMKFNPTTIPPEDAQFLMTRTFQVEEIARLYGVPLHMLQSQSKTTSWGSGIAQMSLGFLIYTVEPWLVRWEQELDRKLFNETEIASGFYVRHNVNALLRADAESRSHVYTAALSKATGWMSRDEVRALEDLNPDGIENQAPGAGAPLPRLPTDGAPPIDEPEDDEP